MSKITIGVDISKAKFDVALLGANDKIKHKKFDNNLAGFKALIQWLEKHQTQPQNLHICMEATGPYGEALALFLWEAGYTISVVNPAQIKGFGRSQLARTKTDKADAKLIAQFCRAIAPKPWQPQPIDVRELRALVHRLEALQDMHGQECNRLEATSQIVRPSVEAVKSQLSQEIECIKKQIRDHINHHPNLRDKKLLLETIPGVGESTIAQVLAFIHVQAFENARQLAAFVGLNPQHRQSGSSVRKPSHLSKIGNSNLRKAFFFPAIVASRFNPIIKAFSERLRTAGKPKMVVVGAAMRKLIHIIYGVLKSGKEFNENLAVLC